MARCFAALSVVLVCAFGAPAMAAPGAISGHVTDPDGNPLEGICVRAHLPDNSDMWGAHVATDTNGAYTIMGLAPGNYKVHFWDLRPACTTGFDFFLDQWFDGKTDPAVAEIVAVADAATTTGIDATMQEPEAIVGRVTDPAGRPIDGICVSASTTAGSLGGFAQSGLNGYYVIHVPAGQYKVHFFDQGSPCYIGQYVEQWYSDKPDAASADTVVVPSGRATFGVDAVMYEFPSIAGHVQDEASHPISGLCVVANPPGGPVPGVVPPFDTTDAAGDYELGVTPGDWKVQFYDGGFPCSANKYVLQLYNDKPSFDLGDVIHVARGQHVTGINATMKLFAAPPLQPSPAAPPPPPPPPPAAAVKCRVPTLRGLTLAKAKRSLRAHRCRLGKVTRKRATPRRAGRVLSSKPRARSVRPDGTRVAVVLGKRR